MASIHKEFTVAAPAAQVWAAFRDVGAIHTKLAREFVTDTQLEGDSRRVTFANGMSVRERIVTIDDAARRLAYSAYDWQATHHHASFQVFDLGGSRSRVVWIADLLPDDLAPTVDGMMQMGSAAMKRTLEAAASTAGTGAPATDSPDSYRTVTPYLVVEDADAELGFLQAAFGGQEAVCHRNADGTVMHAEVAIGDSLVMLGQAGGPWKPLRAAFYLWVDDVDATYRKALQAGGTSESEPADKPYGHRSGGVVDKNGNTWWISAPIAR
jgi:uncharacterized glyoxalase superfamily protein PhnB